mmetsp:Transcript_10273/g.21762  ORF Transcript_10273/g.21762 Transcript_10273/m.21762 type:complete len:272 (-) Transcript_10273:72-887(-)
MASEQFHDFNAIPTPLGLSLPCAYASDKACACTCDVSDSPLEGQGRCALQCQLTVQTSALEFAEAEEAFGGLLQEHRIGGVLALQLGRFGSSNILWEIRLHAEGYVVWHHDDPGARLHVWEDRHAFVRFWASMTEQAAHAYTARLLGLSDADARIRLSGQFALGNLRALAERNHQRRCKAASMSILRPKVLLPPGLQAQGSEASVACGTPGAPEQLPPLGEQAAERLCHTALQPPCLKLILPPWPLGARAASLECGSVCAIQPTSGELGGA